MPNDTFLILVKIQPIKGTVHLVYIELEFFVKNKCYYSDSNQLIVFLHQFGPGITSPVSERVAAFEMRVQAAKKGCAFHNN